MKFHLLGADDRPAAFGLHAAHMGQRRRVAITHAVAVRHLVEAVAGGHRTDLHRLEQHVITARPRLRRAPIHPLAHVAPRHCIDRDDRTISA
ncbi:hypothetical protein D3C72_2353570 [compost metagenome]